MREFVSIIVPIYNTENYLEDCITSIINQTYENIDILLIDDGSTDSSGTIADFYSKRDERVRVFHKINGGLSDARNFGIENAKGQYITFIDSDDYVENKFIEIMLSNLINYDADISGCMYKRTKKRLLNKTTREISVNPIIMLWDTKTAIKKMLRQEDGFTTSACALLYKMKCFKNIRYPVGAYFEDLGTTYLVLNNAERIVRTSSCLYHYYEREGSISNKKFNERYMDQYNFAKNICTFIENNYPDLINDAISRLVGVCFNLYMTINKDQMQLYSAEKQILTQTIKQYRWKLIYDRLTPLKVKIACMLSYLGMSACRKVYYSLKVKGK